MNYKGWQRFDLVSSSLTMAYRNKAYALSVVTFNIYSSI